jgi:hypothetical protein
MSADDDLGTLERVRNALLAEAAELERDGDKSTTFIEGLRYGAAFVGTRIPLTPVERPRVEPQTNGRST